MFVLLYVNMTFSHFMNYYASQIVTQLMHAPQRPRGLVGRLHADHDVQEDVLQSSKMELKLADQPRRLTRHQTGIDS